MARRAASRRSRPAAPHAPRRIGARPEKVVHGGTDDSQRRAGRQRQPRQVRATASSKRADPLRFGPVGIGADPSEVYTVHYKNLAAVVSDAPLEVLDSTRENVLAHERVNETVMREHTVIPMSFGTIFKTREDIIELLRSAAEAFGDVLNKMQNKLEFGLKVLWDRDQAVREVESEDEDISRLKKEISGQKGPTYFARMQYGRLVDAALHARSERYVAAILDELRDVSVASRINKPIGDKMIMNAAFLISRDQEQAFDRKVKSIASRFDKLTFKYTGPWPPYNFVNIRSEARKGLRLRAAGLLASAYSHQPLADAPCSSSIPSSSAACASCWTRLCGGRSRSAGRFVAARAAARGADAVSSSARSPRRNSPRSSATSSPRIREIKGRSRARSRCPPRTRSRASRSKASSLRLNTSLT